MNTKIKPSDLVESFSGIRGIYGSGITEELLDKYLLAYLKIFPNSREKFLIAGDTRPSTESLRQSGIATLRKAGVKEIIDLGVVPIQVAEYAVFNMKAAGGVYISASHNEPEYNGFKFLREDGAVLYPEQADKFFALAHSVKQGEIQRVSLSVKVFQKQKEAIDNYIDFILKKIGPKALAEIKKAELNILIDPNGGSAIVVLEKLFNKLAVKAKIVNNQLGQFVRMIEPKAESLTPLAKELSNSKYQFASGFDCDADRVEFILPPLSDFAQKIGTAVLSGQYVLALCCDAALKGAKNETVVVVDATSYLVRDVVKKHQSVIKEVEVGEINVVKEMECRKSVIGGEGSSSGVIVPPIKCRDGIMAIVLILKMLAEEKKSLVEVLNSYPQYYSGRTKLACRPDQAIGVRVKLEQYFRGKGYVILKTGDETGGLKALADANSYVWFRQSKTEPGVFRIHAEGDGSQKKVNALLQEGIAAFQRFSF